MIEVLDLFCKQGGASMGYSQALDELGLKYHITGIDREPQPLYPFDFIQANAFDVLREIYSARNRNYVKYDFIHASPMCQKYSLGSARWDKVREDQLPMVEAELINIFVKHGINFVIENVERAPFTLQTITLCGVQFGMNIIRHRKFACSRLLWQPYHSKPHPERGKFVTCAGHGGHGSNALQVWRDVMGIDWMDKPGLSQAVPPVYTKYIGLQVFQVYV